MVNPLQRIRQENLEWIMKQLAKSMPDGHEDASFRGFLRLKFSPATANEYLETLTAAKLAECVEGVWKIL